MLTNSHIYKLYENNFLLNTNGVLFIILMEAHKTSIYLYIYIYTA